jgi:hypothetical protein
MTKVSRAARIALVVVVCTVAIVLIAALWAQRRTRQTGLMGERGEQDPTSREHVAVLTWKASPSAVIGYNVYRAEDPGGPYKKLNRIPLRETTYKDSAVESSHAYSYMVTAVDTKGRESGFSNQVRATVPSL